GPVNALAWSPDGKLLASGGQDQTVQVWKAETGKHLYTLEGQQNVVTALDWSPDGARLAVLTPVARIHVWHMPVRRLLGRLVMLPNAQHLAISPDGHYSGSPKIDQHLVYVVQTARGQETLTPTEFAEKYGWRNDPAKV